MNERYQRGAEMLGNSVLSVRMGGIYALRRLAEEHPNEYRVQITRLLCAFARHPIKDNNIAPTLTGEKEQDDVPQVLRADVQDAMYMIGSRSQTDAALEKDGEHPYLRNADLEGLQLLRTNLSNAWLTNVNLSGAGIRQANLSGARLRQATLAGTFLDGANLSKANLQNANLSGAHLRNADLSNADLRGAILSGADLTRTNLSAAKLSANGSNPAKGLIQDQLNRACAAQHRPPDLTGVICAETGTQLVWLGNPLFSSAAENPGRVEVLEVSE